MRARPSFVLVLVLVPLATLAGCLRDTAFHCTASDQCGDGGTCQGVGFCSSADSACPSGARFGASAGPYANQCVDELDAGVDAADDAMSEAGAGCPASFMTIANGQGNHRYRALPQTGSWQTQRMACASAGGYLAVPDSQPELGALVVLAGGPESWLGISDAATEGVFVTVKGAPATFLPWDTGQPDDAPPGEDCVAVLTSTGKLIDERCSRGERATCECEP